MPQEPAGGAGDRLAKVIARSGLCSRRDAEGWIKDGRVAVNGTVIRTPAFNVTDRDRIEVDGAPLAAREGTRVWLYHKPPGLVVTEKDPEGRPTIFEKLSAEGLPRVVTIGRLDINTEGLLLLTNDGGLKRVLELPATGWLRRYRVRAHGTVTQASLYRLKEGTQIEGIKYGPIEATLEREQGSNVWLLVSLREGKNREVKNVLASLGLEVNRLIRVSYGPFQLGDLPVGGVEAVKARVLRDQLGRRLAKEAGADFESEAATVRPVRSARAKPDSGNNVAIGQSRFRFTDREDDEADAARPPRPERPGKGSPPHRRSAPARPEPFSAGPPRKIHFEDGRESVAFEEKSYGKKPPRGAAAGARPGEKRAFGGGDSPSRGGDKGPRAPRDRDNGPGARAPRGRVEGASARPSRSSDQPRPARQARGADDSRPARPPRGQDDRRPPRSARAQDDTRPARPPRQHDDTRPARPARGADDAGPARPPRGTGAPRPPRSPRGRDDARPPRAPRDDAKPGRAPRRGDGDRPSRAAPANATGRPPRSGARPGRPGSPRTPGPDRPRRPRG